MIRSRAGKRVEDGKPVVANGKRFMAYDIVKRLKLFNKTELLKAIQQAVSEDEKKKRQTARGT